MTAAVPGSGHEQAQHLGERVASEMLRLSGQEPVHLHVLARRLGVRAILIDDALTADGCTKWDNGGPTIYVRPGLRLGRRRFTLAHELTHVVLGHGRLDESPRSPAKRDFEERVCDASAASLLMPKHLLEDLPYRALTLEALRNRAEELSVSISALVVQVNSTFDVDYALLQLRRSERGSWTVMPPVGRSAKVTGRMTLAPDYDETLDELTTETTPLCVELVADGRGVTCIGEADRHGTRAVALVRPTGVRMLTGLVSRG